MLKKKKNSVSTFYTQHGKVSEKPLKYSHLDIAPSCGNDLDQSPTGAPILALANRFFAKEFEEAIAKKD